VKGSEVDISTASVGTSEMENVARISCADTWHRAIRDECVCKFNVYLSIA